MKVRLDMDTAEVHVDMPAVPRVGDDVEFADVAHTVRAVIWTPELGDGEPYEQDVVVVLAIP